MSIQLNVDKSSVQFCITAPIKYQDVLSELLNGYVQIEFKEQIAFCMKFSQDNFQKEFLHKDVLKQIQIILNDNLKREIGIAGFGGVDIQYFEKFRAILSKFTQFEIFKIRGVRNSLKTLDYVVKNNLNWFFNFTELISVINLNAIQQGIKIQKISSLKPPEYPFLFVNLNKNATFFSINSDSVKKLSGSIIGDSTIEGIIQLLGCREGLNQTFQQAFENGNSCNMDLNVGDIYGDKTDFQLPKDLIASSMGKAQFLTKENVKSLDVVKSLWYMFAINLGMIAYLSAENEKIEKIIVNSTKLTFEPFLYTLQVLINTFSKGKQTVNFIQNSEYFPILDI